jgi:hypothetical protein
MRHARAVEEGSKEIAGAPGDGDAALSREPREHPVVTVEAPYLDGLLRAEVLAHGVVDLPGGIGPLLCHDAIPPFPP